VSRVTITVDGVPRRVPVGVSVAVALIDLGVTAFRRDGNGAARLPVCGMGTCFECRVTIDGVAAVRACLEPVREGLKVETMS
jgi:sarcosine oxidase subunit alpha